MASIAEFSRLSVSSERVIISIMVGTASMRQENLTDDDKQRLVVESRSLNGLQGALSSIYDYIEQSVSATFSSGNGLKPNRLEELNSAIDFLVIKHMRPLKSRYDSRPGSKATGTPPAFESCHVLVMPSRANSSAGENVYQLFSLRLLVSKREIDVVLRPIPAAFRFHAASRLLQRAPAVDFAMRQTAMDLANWTAFLKHSEWAGINFTSTQMFIPAFRATGLILGNYDPNYGLDVGVRTTISNGTVTTSEIPADPLDPAMFFANTFVGDDDLAESQRHFKKRLLEWKTSCGDRMDVSQADGFWPDRVLSAASGGGLSAEDVEALELYLTRPTTIDIVGRNAKFKTGPLLADGYATYEPEGGGETEPFVFTTTREPVHVVGPRF
jgi:hypothetical protein